MAGSRPAMTIGCLLEQTTLERQLHPRRQLHAAGDLLHLARHHRVDLAFGVAMRGDDQVLQHLRIRRIDKLRVDVDLPQVALAVQRYTHEAGARLAVDLQRLELRLHFLHAGLHLRRLLHQTAKVLHRSGSISSEGSASGGANSGRSASSTVTAGKPYASTLASCTVSMRAPGNASSI